MQQTLGILWIPPSAFHNAYLYFLIILNEHGQINIEFRRQCKLRAIILFKKAKNILLLATALPHLRTTSLFPQCNLLCIILTFNITLEIFTVWPCLIPHTLLTKNAHVLLLPRRWATFSIYGYGCTQSGIWIQPYEGIRMSSIMQMPVHFYADCTVPERGDLWWSPEQG